VAKYETSKNAGEAASFPVDSLNHQVVSHKWLYFAAFFLIGIINNNGCVMVQAGSSKLAEDFHKEDFMASF